MSAFLSNGAKLFVSPLGTVKAMSAVTNATEAVATLEASHGIVVGDILVVTSSGWGALAGRPARAKTVATNDVTLEEINTTSTVTYPVGLGVGTIKEANAWTQITQITDATFAGGEPNFTEVNFLEEDRSRRLFTRFSAEGLDLTIAHDATLGWYPTVRTASDSGAIYAFRLNLKSGAVRYYTGTLAFNENPTLGVDAVQAVSIAISFDAKSIGYAS